MFEVFDPKDDYEITKIKVYAVVDDSHGYPKFLIYENERWVWKSAKHFMPYH